MAGELDRRHIRKFASHQAADEADLRHYRAKSPEEKLSEMQVLRELNQPNAESQEDNAYRKGLRRVLRLLKQA